MKSLGHQQVKNVGQKTICFADIEAINQMETQLEFLTTNRKHEPILSLCTVEKNWRLETKLPRKIQMKSFINKVKN